MSDSPRVCVSAHIGRLASAFALLSSVLFSSSLHAQTEADEESTGPGIIVVLEPRLEQEIDLSSKVAEATGREVKGQTWFLEQVKSRGFKAKEILTRPDDVKWVLEGANIALVVYLPRDDERLLVKLVGEDGREITSRILLEDASQPFGDIQTQTVLTLVTDEVGSAEPEAEPALLGQAEPEAPAEAETEVIKPSADLQKKMQTRGEEQTGDRKWLHFYAGGTLTERAYVLTDRTLRSVSLRTPLYPGYRLGVVVYPFWSDKPPARSAGFLAEFGHGFDTLTLVDGAERIPANVTHLDVELAFLYRFQGFEENPYGQAPAIALRVGAHLSSYDVDNQVSTPLSTSYLAVDIGARVEQSLWVDWLGLEWDMVAHPFVGDLTDRASGEQTWGLGLSTDASINVRLFAGAHFRVGWGARVIRTWFEGIAANNFEDLDSIIFEHSPRAALNYWW